jgi:hypothetical protein
LLPNLRKAGLSGDHPAERKYDPFRAYPKNAPAAVLGGGDAAGSRLEEV